MAAAFAAALPRAHRIARTRILMATQASGAQQTRDRFELSLRP
jgi:hypothetical protein